MFHEFLVSSQECGRMVKKRMIQEMTKQEKIDSCKEHLESWNGKLFEYVQTRQRIAHIIEKQLFDSGYTVTVALDELRVYTERIERVQKKIIYWNEKLAYVYDEE